MISNVCKRANSVNAAFTNRRQGASRVTARSSLREFVMYRVQALAAATMALGLGACSMGSVNLSQGYATDPPAQKSLGGSSSTGLGGETLSRSSRTKGEQVASLARPSEKSVDRAPPGQSEKAPKGALADRDFSATALDAEKARSLINSYRASKGLKSLRLNPALTEAAKAHSRDLAKWDRISHFGSDGSNPWDRVKRTGYNAKLAAENVGTGQASLEEVFKGWQESPGHNKNLLLADASEMGIALVQDPKTEFRTFWTLVLGSAH